MFNHLRKDDKILNYFIEQIRLSLSQRLKEMILFGSMARGDDREGSNYDILIIVDKVTKAIKEVIDNTAGETLYRYDKVITPFIISEERYEKEKFNPLLINVRKEGIRL